MGKQEKIRAGGCLCGAVRYAIVGELRDVFACHCNQCRKQSGHFYAATSAMVDDVSIKGEDNLTKYKASSEATRYFCKTCGSALFWKSDESDTISILAGGFDEPSGLKLGCHIYCADKGDYYELDDGLPQFDQSD